MPGLQGCWGCGDDALLTPSFHDVLSRIEAEALTTRVMQQRPGTHEPTGGGPDRTAPEPDDYSTASELPTVLARVPPLPSDCHACWLRYPEERAVPQMDLPGWVTGGQAS